MEFEGFIFRRSDPFGGQAKQVITEASSLVGYPISGVRVFESVVLTGERIDVLPCPVFLSIQFSKNAVSRDESLEVFDTSDELDLFGQFGR